MQKDVLLAHGRSWVEQARLFDLEHESAPGEGYGEIAFQLRRLVRLSNGVANGNPVEADPERLPEPVGGELQEG